MRYILITATLALCSSTLLGGAEPKKPEPRELKELPVIVTVKQRTTEVVPGSDGKMQVTIDDITRGQVIVSLSHTKHGVVMAPTSVTLHDARSFKLGAESYQLRVKAWNNSLLGEDFAQFEFSLPPDAKVEKRRMEKLTASVEGMKDCAFIRQGREITPKEEAEVLRALWEQQTDTLLTAERFIGLNNMMAELGGTPYLVRLSDKTVVPAGAYLLEQLRGAPEKKKGK